MADGGEDVEDIIEELANIDHNAMEEEENLNNEEDDDDEDDDDEGIADRNSPFPEEWNMADASSMECMDMHGSNFRYGCSMIDVNQVFPNKQELKDTVSWWAVMSLREVWVKNSSPTKYNVVSVNFMCMHTNPKMSSIG